MEKKRNYQKELEKTLEKLKFSQSDGVYAMPKQKLLLHACCGPCSSYVIEYLAKFFDITIFFYNPNIHPKSEHDRRLSELENFLEKFPAALENGVEFVRADYEPCDFLRATNVKEEPNLAEEGEKGERCRRCYKFRLKKAADYARQNGFDYFCTTLSISPFKDAEKINEIGENIYREECVLAEEKGGSKTKWLFSDFKKNGGFKRSLEISKEFGLYRQDYCGCVYSMRNR